MKREDERGEDVEFFSKQVGKGRGREDKRRKEGEDNIGDITWTEQENDEKLI